MGYFDDPKHRSQWERELSALRMEKARIQAGLPPVDEQRAVSKNLEKTAPEKDFYDEEELGFAQEKQSEEISAETTFYREPEKEKPERAVGSERKAPAKPRSERVHADGEYRVRMTFEELLREENVYQPPKLTQKPREMTRQKEVSNEL